VFGILNGEIEMSRKQPLLAIEGGSPSRPSPIEPLFHVEQVTRDRISKILDSGQFSGWYGGPVAREFEKEFASRFGANHAIAVNSGTSALHAAVASLGLKHEDEVIIPAAAYVSAASVVVQEGAIPILCDIEEDTYDISVKDFERRITNKTRAAIVVHFWGCPAPMGPISEIARQRGIVVIEDCGQSHGSTVGDSVTGAIGDFGCFSFAPRKHITTGEGGMVTCRSDHAAARVRELVNKGKGPGWLDYHSVGFSYAMGELDAAIGLDGLRNLDKELACRRAAAEVYRRTLADTPLRLPDDPPWGKHVYFKVPILLPPDMAQLRDLFHDVIAAENVSCRVPHPPVYSIPWLKEYVAERGKPYDPASFPATADLLPRMVEVESGPNLSDQDVEVSANAVLRAWNYICDKERLARHL
jgi:perosamine synthetase